MTIRDFAARFRGQETVAPECRWAILAEAYRAHLDAVYRYVYRRVGNREMAEDLTADVFVKAAQGLQAGHSAQAVRTWLYAAARTTIADYWRGHAGETIDIANPEHTLSTPETEGGGDTAAARRVAALLAALPEWERRVLTLRFLHGCSPVETARELRLSTGNVKVVQHRALKRAAALGADLEEANCGQGRRRLLPPPPSVLLGRSVPPWPRERMRRLPATSTPLPRLPALLQVRDSLQRSSHLLLQRRLVLP